MEDLLGLVLMLILMGVFALLIAPVAMVLLWLNRKLLADRERQPGDQARDL